VVWQGRRFAVVRIEKRWRTPEGPGFRVETEPGIPFELRYSEQEKAWAIQPMAELDEGALEPGGRGRDKQEGEKQHPHRTDYEDKEVLEER
jgi:hypothetical protein